MPFEHGYSCYYHTLKLLTSVWLACKFFANYFLMLCTKYARLICPMPCLLFNLQEVFGDNRWTWFLPVFTSFGDGITYPQRNQLDEEAGLLVASPPTTEFPSEDSVPMMIRDSEDGGWGGTVNRDSSSISRSRLLSQSDVDNNSSRSLNPPTSTSSDESAYCSPEKNPSGDGTVLLPQESTEGALMAVPTSTAHHHNRDLMKKKVHPNELVSVNM